MTPPYQVFVDGSHDRSPGAIARVASAMAARYGLPAAELETRLARGRFKVKAGVDRATAETYARDLERLGAVCVVVDATGATVDFAAAAAAAAAAAEAAVGKPALGVPAPRTGSPLPPRPGFAPARPASGPLPPRAADAPVRPASGPLASLASAKSGARQDLGALGRDDGAIALSSLDGEDEPIIEPTSLSTASFGPATPVAPTASSPARPRAASSPVEAAGAPRAMTGPPADMFVPPDAADDDMELALVDVVKPVGTTSSTATPARGTMAPPLAPAAEAPVAARPAGPSLGERARDLLANARVRFAAGVLAAVLIGFLPATIVASARESSTYGDIDHKLRVRYAAIDSDEEYAALDRARSTALDTKYAERREIALIAVLVWAAAGAGLAYVWFRRVPWDRLSRRPG